MGQVSAVLRSVDMGRGASGYGFWCPGCDGYHAVIASKPEGVEPAAIIDGRPCWGFNGNVDRPTFTPSILVTYNGNDAGTDGARPACCHSFVTDGRIQFLGDCTHALVGQTVDLPPFPADFITGRG